MRQQRTFTIVMGLLFTLLLTETASAFYSPRLGRFLSRDPLEEPGHVLLKTQRQPTRFIPRDSLDNNGYTGMLNNAISWFDPDGAEATTQPAPTGEPAGTDCGIRVKRSPLCLEHMYCFKNLGHTWIETSSGTTFDYPPGYINESDHSCQKQYVHKLWGTVTTGNGNSCSEIEQCLRDKQEEWAARWFFLLFNDCREFTKAALSECGLERVAPPTVDEGAVKRYCTSPCAKVPTDASKYKGG